MGRCDAKMGLQIPPLRAPNGPMGSPDATSEHATSEHIYVHAIRHEQAVYQIYTYTYVWMSVCPCMQLVMNGHIWSN